MSALVTQKPMNAMVSEVMRKYLAAQGGMQSELGSGVTGGFGIISYKGKVWSQKYRGEETIIMREDGDGTKQTLELVIVKASSTISKIYYIDGYVEGSTAPPDCWSVDGVKPDAASPKKQCNTCAGCPMNAWGSKVTNTGKPAKACQDSKRLAVVPYDNIKNELYGGPMLLRVPAASLSDMKLYDDKLLSQGFAYFTVATKIGFDPTESYPKFVFSPWKPLTDEESETIIEMRESEQVRRLLNSAVETVTADVASPDVTSGPAPSLSQQATAAAPNSATASQPDPAIAAAADQAAATAAAKAALDAAVAAAAVKAKAEAEAAAKVQREAIEAQVRAEVEARLAAANPTPTTTAASTSFFEGEQASAAEPRVSATPVAATTATPPVTAAAAPDVVDAVIVSEQNNDPATPAKFDALLDGLLSE